MAEIVIGIGVTIAETLIMKGGEYVWSKITDNFQETVPMKSYGLNRYMPTDASGKSFPPDLLGNVSIKMKSGAVCSLPNYAYFGPIEAMTEFPDYVLKLEDLQPINAPMDHIVLGSAEDHKVKQGVFVGRYKATSHTFRLSAAFMERYKGQLVNFITQKGEHYLVSLESLACLKTKDGLKPK